MTQFKTFTDAERAALKLHGLSTSGPSQLSDSFVIGMRYAKEQAAVMEAAPAVVKVDTCNCGIGMCCGMANCRL